MKMTHLKINSSLKKLPVRAETKGPGIVDPCAGLTGLERKKCECKAYKGGVVY